MPAFYRELVSGELEVWNRAVAQTPTDHTRRMIANTYGMVTHIDEEIGRVLGALDRFGQRENTAVLFVSDHGDMMGDHGLHFKGTFTYRGCTEIPTIVSIPWIPGTGVQLAETAAPTCAERVSRRRAGPARIRPHHGLGRRL